MSECVEKKIKEWMSIFQDLYEEADSNRTIEQIWMATMAHCSETGEAIRRYDFPDLIGSMAHTFSWICSFINKCNKLAETYPEDLFSYEGCLSDIVSSKYPNVCGHCSQSKCMCEPKVMDAKKDKSAIYKELYEQHKKTFKHEDLKISDWLDMFDRIYGQQIHVQSFENIGFHFLEEVGECAKAIRSLGELKNVIYENVNGLDTKYIKKLSTYKGILSEYDNVKKIPIPNSQEWIDYFKSKNPDDIKSRIVHAKMDIIIELADTFSWFCSIINKANEILKNVTKNGTTKEPKKLNLEGILNTKYYKEGKKSCSSCGEEKCVCSFFISNEKNK